MTAQEAGTSIVDPPAPSPAAEVESAPTGRRGFGLHRPGRQRSARYKWVILGVGFAAQAGFAIAFQGIPVTGAVMQDDYRLTTGQLGLILSVMSFGIAISDVVWGILTDRHGERRILVTGLAALTVAFALCAVFLVPHAGGRPSVALLGLGLLIAGILGGSVNGASGRAIMAWFKKNERGFAISVRVTAVPVGGAIGAALLPMLALHAGFGVLFAVLTGVSLLITLSTYLWLDEPPLDSGLAVPKGSRVEKKAARAASTVRNPLKVLEVWRIAVASGLLNFPQFIVLTFGSVFLHDVKHVGLGVVALVVSLVQIGGAVGRVSGGRWTDRRGGRYRRTLVKAQGSIVVLGFLLVGLLEHGPALPIVVVLTVTGMIACGWHGVAYAEIAEVAGAERSGTALGLENTMVFGGAFVTPLVIPLVLEATSSSWTTVMLLVGALPALLAVLLIPREPKEDRGALRA